MAIYAARRRHLTKKRVRHSKDLKAFATKQNTRLSVAQAKAAGTLTMATNPSDTQTVTIGAKVYTFQTVLTNVNGNVLIGANAAASLTNLFRAINLGGTAGTDYALAMTLNADVVATNPTATTLVATAKAFGTAPNAKATTTTVTGASWNAATLLGGLATYVFDCLTSLLKNTADEIRAASSYSQLAS